MPTLSPLRHRLLGLQGQFYLLTYWSTLRRFLGIPVSRYVKGLPIILALLALLFGRSVWPPLLLIGFALLVQLGYWRARRQSYNTFVGETAVLPPNDALKPLPANQHVKFLATGIYSLNNREASVLLAAAEYWHVPLGEHVVMVEQVRGYFLYQFFNAETIQKVEPGWLVFGKTPHRSLAITFRLNWGPDFSDPAILQFVQSEEKPPPPRYRTVYFSFAHERDLTAVYHTIVHDARLLRSSKQ